MSRRAHRRPLHPSLASCLALATAAVTICACGAQTSENGAPGGDANTGALYVNAVLTPPSPTGAMCFYVPDPTAPTLSHGLVDGALATSYAPTLLVGNMGAVRIAVQGAHVKVVDPADGSTVEDDTVLAAGTVEAGEGTVSSYTTLQLTILSSSAVHHFTPAAGQAAEPAVAHVQLYGTTASGASVESGDFQFPVSVCAGCLVSIPPGGTATYCSGAEAEVGYAVPCVVGQDQPVDCQLCYATSAACHGT